MWVNCTPYLYIHDCKPPILYTYNTYIPVRICTLQANKEGFKKGIWPYAAQAKKKQNHIGVYNTFIERLKSKKKSAHAHGRILQIAEKKGCSATAIEHSDSEHTLFIVIDRLRPT